MNSSLVKDTLLCWNDSFIGKDKKTVYRVGALCVFWSVWWVGNDIIFTDEVLSIQIVKSFFVFCHILSLYFLNGFSHVNVHLLCR